MMNWSHHRCAVSYTTFAVGMVGKWFRGTYIFDFISPIERRISGYGRHDTSRQTIEAIQARKRSVQGLD